MKRRLGVLLTMALILGTGAFSAGYGLVDVVMADEPPECGSGQTCQLGGVCFRTTHVGCPDGKVRDQELDSKCFLNGNWTGVCCGEITYTAPVSTCHYPE